MNKFLFLFLISLSSLAQVKGIVIDEFGKPIPYVNISIENENIWTNAEENGMFAINVTQDKNLIFSALGYEKRIIKASASERVVLTESALKLDEVIVEKRKETLAIEIGKSGNDNTTLISGNRGWLNAKYFPYESAYAKTKFIKKAIVITKSTVKNAIFKLRVFSKGENGAPDLDLIEEDIIVAVKRGRQKNKIDLSKYNLVIPKEGIFVAFESLVIERNKYDFNYTMEGNSKKHTEKYYAPDLSCSFTDEENTYHMANGKWVKMNRWHNNEAKGSLLKFNNKVLEPSINIILTN
jgi:uncharacterized membrane protein